MHPLLKELQGDNDPHDVLEITPDVVLAARTDKEFPMLAPGVMGIATDAPNRIGPGGSAGASAPSVDATFRATDAQPAQLPRQRSSMRKWARRALVGVVLALCSTVAATAWQHYGDTAKAMIANWVPQLVATSSPAATPAPSEQPDTPDTQDAAATAAPAQPAPPAPSTESVVASPPSPEQAQLQSMAQQIEQLKASVEQLKASQEQMSRDMAKTTEAKTAEAKASEVRASEPNLRPRIAAPRIAAPLPRTAAPPVRKPRPPISAAQYAPPPLLPPTAAPPMAPQAELPPQSTVESDGNPVVRPPLPLR
jgi:hypothetical protein